MLPALVKESNSNGGNIDQDIVMDNDLAYAQRLDPYWNEIIEYKQFHGSETKNVIISTFTASMNNIVLFILEAQRLERD